MGHRGQFAGPETLAEAEAPYTSSPLLMLLAATHDRLMCRT
jgi:hypothetical protein